MSLILNIEEEVKIKYREKLNTELNKDKPNYIEVDFLQKVLERIENGNLF